MPAPITRASEWVSPIKVARHDKDLEKAEKLEKDKEAFCEKAKDLNHQNQQEVEKHEQEHQNQLMHLLHNAVLVVEETNTGKDYDNVDTLIAEKDMTKFMRCSNCQSLYPQRKRVCSVPACGGKKLEKQSQDKEERRTEKTSLFIQDVLEDEEATETVRYGHIAAGDVNPKNVHISEPVLTNPASKGSIICVLPEIGLKSGIKIYGSGERLWTFVYCDNLPYFVIRNLKNDFVLCTHQSCELKETIDRSFMNMAALEQHYKNNHSEDKCMFYVREFDWVVLGVADGHYEYTALKAYFSLNWEPFIKVMVKELGFTSDKQLGYIAGCKDHHLSWEIFCVTVIACLRELVLLYIRASLSKAERPTADGFLLYHKNAQDQDSPAYTFMFDMITIYGQAIFNFRGGVRRNNSHLAESAKHYIKDLFWARQHPRYQQLEVYDNVQKCVMNEQVNAFDMKHYSVITNSGPNQGEGYDYRLKEVNWNLKSLVSHSQVPTDEQWVQMARLCEPA